MKRTDNMMQSVAARAAIACLLALGLGATELALGAQPAYAAETEDIPEIEERSTAASEEQAVAGLEDFSDYGLVGFESVELNSHTNSNIATGHLEANGQTFGTNGVAEPETSLIGTTDGEMTQVTTDNGSKVVLGEATVEEADSENAKMVDGSKVTANGGSGDSIANGETPDFEKWQEQAGETSRGLSGLRDSAVYDDADMNDRRIVLADPSGTSSVTVDAQTLSKHPTEVRVNGLEGTLVVNVDAAGSAELSLPPFVVNGESNRERTGWSGFNAILNLFDSHADDGQFRGEASFMGRVIGIVLAPYAKVVANHNIDGQIIANEVVVNGEFHRDSFTGGSLPAPVEPEEPAEPAEPEPEQPTEPAEPTDPEGPEEPEPEPEQPTEPAEPEQPEEPTGPENPAPSPGGESPAIPDDGPGANTPLEPQASEPGTPAPDNPETPDAPIGEGGTPPADGGQTTPETTPEAEEEPASNAGAEASGESSAASMETAGAITAPRAELSNEVEGYTLPKTGDVPLAPIALGSAAMLAAALYAAKRKSDDGESEVSLG